VQYLVTMTVTIPIEATDAKQAFEDAKRDGLTAPWSASPVRIDLVTKDERGHDRYTKQEVN
jgi:hypothetical protein